ncbi:MAG: hypothetical protein WCB58_09000 [Acidobacteriaceae bacterium]
MKALEKQIRAAIESGILNEPFNAAMIREACPGWEDKTYHIVLSEHAAGNGCSSEWFERVSFGLYRLIRPSDNTKRNDRRGSEQNALDGPTLGALE